MRPYCAPVIALAVVLAALLGTGCRPAAPPQLAAPEGESVQDVAQRLARARRAAFWRPHNPKVLVKLGQAYLDAGLFNDAYGAFRRAADADPKSFDACLGLAKANAKLHDPSEALDWLSRARVLDPQNLEAAQLEGRLLLMAGRFEKAVDTLRAAAASDPSSAATWLNLASAYAVQGRDDEAVAAAQHAVQAKPDSPTTHLAFAMLLRRARRLSEAEAEYRKTLDLAPKDPAAMVGLASLLVDQKRKLEEARQLATKATDDDAYRPEAAVVAAWAMHLQGDTRRAAGELAKLVDSNPHNPEAWKRLAIMLRQLGNKTAADEAAKRAAIYVSASNPVAAYADQKNGGPVRAKDN